jgi:hypothetical protein
MHQLSEESFFVNLPTTAMKIKRSVHIIKVKRALIVLQTSVAICPEQE